MGIKLLLIIYLFSGAKQLILASEIDSFTRREEFLKNLKDPTNKINQKINWYIQLSIKKANKKSHSCDLEKLHKYSKNFLGGHFRFFLGPRYMRHNNLYRWLKYAKKYSTGIDVGHIKVKHSIYRNFGGLNAPSLALVSKINDTMSYILQIDNLLIGTDKISGHFFQRGFWYFADHYGLSVKGQEFITAKAREKFALDTMIHSEVSLYGAKSTGISSFADLAANFQGLRFWNKFTGLAKDIITQEVPRPYVKCLAKKWVQVQQVDIMDYLNAAWDEGYNCSKFQKKKLARSVKRRVEKLDNYRAGFHCPLDLARLQSTKSVYGEYYDKLVNEVAYLKIQKKSHDRWVPPEVFPYIDDAERAARKASASANNDTTFNNPFF